MSHLLGLFIDGQKNPGDAGHEGLRRSNSQFTELTGRVETSPRTPRRSDLLGSQLHGNLQLKPLKLIPSRELTYPKLGKGKSSSKGPFLGGYVSFQEGIAPEKSMFFFPEDDPVKGWPFWPHHFGQQIQGKTLLVSIG